MVKAKSAQQTEMWLLKNNDVGENLTPFTGLGVQISPVALFIFNMGWLMLTSEQIIKIKELYECSEICVYKEVLIGGRCITKIKMDGISRNRQTSAWLVELKYNKKLTKNDTVDHIDEDKTNDSMDNLQILTRAENAKKSYKFRTEHGGVVIKRHKMTPDEIDQISGSKNKMAKLTDNQILEIREIYTTGKCSIEEICVMYSLSRKTIFNVVTGRSYKNVGGDIHTSSRGNTNYESDIINIMEQIKTGIFLTDISKKMGINRGTLRDRIKSYCVRNGLEYPKKAASVDNTQD